MLNLILMKFDPVTGKEKPYPSQVDQYREYHGKLAWLYNPYTGIARNANDIGSDTFGQAIQAPIKFYDPGLAEKVTETAQKNLKNLKKIIDRTSPEFWTLTQTDSILRAVTNPIQDVQNSNSFFAQLPDKKENLYSGMLLKDVPFDKLELEMEVVSSDYDRTPLYGRIISFDKKNLCVYVEYTIKDSGNSNFPVIWSYFHSMSNNVKIK